MPPIDSMRKQRVPKGKANYSYNYSSVTIAMSLLPKRRTSIAVATQENTSRIRKSRALSLDLVDHMETDKVPNLQQWREHDKTLIDRLEQKVQHVRR